MKPMSLAYSRKQRRQMSRPYLRIRPRTLWQTRLRRAREGDRDQAFGGGVPADPPRGNVACSAGQGAPVARAGRVLLGMDAPDVRHAARMRGGITQRGGGRRAARGALGSAGLDAACAVWGPPAAPDARGGVLRASSSLGTHKAGAPGPRRHAGRRACRDGPEGKENLRWRRPHRRPPLRRPPRPPPPCSELPPPRRDTS